MSRELARGRKNEIELRREEEDWRVEKGRVKKVERKNKKKKKVREEVEREKARKKVESKKK